MSRSGYSYDCENWELICWRGAVKSAIRGERGQRLLRDLIAALDAMPVKELIANHLERNGEVCALGAVGRARNIDMSGIDSEDRSAVGKTFDIAPALAAEIAFQNDEDASWSSTTSSKRWEYMRKWAVDNLNKPEIAAAPGE
jgi:hypothetical protein